MRQWSGVRRRDEDVSSLFKKESSMGEGFDSFALYTALILLRQFQHLLIQFPDFRIVEHVKKISQIDSHAVIARTKESRKRSIERGLMNV